MRRACWSLLAAVLAVALAGCGSSQTTSSAGSGGASSAGAPSASTTVPAAASLTTRSTASRPAIARRGQAYRVLADTVCRAVRSGAPRELGLRVGVPQLQAYSRQALAPAQRTAISLERLPAPASARPAVKRVAGAYRDLVALYTAALRLRARTHAGATITAVKTAEARAAIAATSAGLIACAPHSPA